MNFDETRRTLARRLNSFSWTFPATHAPTLISSIVEDEQASRTRLLDRLYSPKAHFGKFRDDVAAWAESTGGVIDDPALHGDLDAYAAAFASTIGRSPKYAWAELVDLATTVPQFETEKERMMAASGLLTYLTGTVNGTPLDQNAVVRILRTVAAASDPLTAADMWDTTSTFSCAPDTRTDADTDAVSRLVNVVLHRDVGPDAIPALVHLAGKQVVLRALESSVRVPGSDTRPADVPWGRLALVSTRIR